MTFFIDFGPEDAPFRIVLAHGAGAGIESPFLTAMADLLVTRGFAVTLFEFDYMSRRRSEKSRRPPPRAEALSEEYRDFVRATAKRSGASHGQRPLIGGKSLGGRVASLIADDLFAAGEISGLVCLGYPFHPPKKPEQLRTEHLKNLACPAIIVQGERDPFGSRTEVQSLSLSGQIAFAWIGDGDHDLGPRGHSGFTRKGNLTSAADAVAAFATGLRRPR